MCLNTHLTTTPPSWISANTHDQSLYNHTFKSIILKNFKLLQIDSETDSIFSKPPLISFKRDKFMGKTSQNFITN